MSTCPICNQLYNSSCFDSKILNHNYLYDNEVLQSSLQNSLKLNEETHSYSINEFSIYKNIGNEILEIFIADNLWVYLNWSDTSSIKLNTPIDFDKIKTFDQLQNYINKIMVFE